MRFEFATPARIIFGAGSIAELPSLAPAFGNHALVVTGANQERAKRHLSALENAGIACRYFSVPGEPAIELVREGAQLARFAGFVIGFGGGSAIDAAKAIAAVAPNSGEPLDYLEVIGEARPLENTPLPFIAIPTTAGTGAEVTRNAVLGSPERRVKASMRNPQMLARLAIVDPDLTRGAPRQVTAACGLDAITQLIEPFVSARANPFADMFCIHGLARAVQALPQVYAGVEDPSAHADMAFASLLSGLALANAGLGAVHGFAAALGGMLNAPHGALCAAVLPHATALNIRALHMRAPNHPALGRYARIAALLTKSADATAKDAAAGLQALCRHFEIPGLSAHGFTAAEIPQAVEKAAAASSMKSNPLALTPAELAEILERAL